MGHRSWQRLPWPCLCAWRISLCCLSPKPQFSPLSRSPLPSPPTSAGYTAASPVVQWFWELVREMDKQDLALLVQFVTGGRLGG